MEMMRNTQENYFFLLELDFRRINQELLVFSYITGNDIRRALLLAEACYDRKQDEIERTAHQQDPEVSTGNFHKMRRMSETEKHSTN